MAASEDDSNNKNNNNSQVRAKCRNCQTIFSAAETLFPKCGSDQRALIGADNSTITINEQPRRKLRREIEIEKRNPRWFYLTVGVTMLAPFTALIPDLNPGVGIAIGLAFGIASLILGKRAYTIIQQIYESESG
jgi:hypothetical protein